MQSKKLGKNISEVDIHTTIEGLWVLVLNQEYFLSHEGYPWFKNATLEQLYNVEFLHGHHLHWPDLDVDLDLDSLENPEKYPLKFIK
ncbi:MAG: DUF2442 domain-containing protein [Deltaproteobacteria bacterium]|nr:DUF2442 domain-containing protein [Deltaproteobacteria bacterium]